MLTKKNKVIKVESIYPKKKNKELFFLKLSNGSIYEISKDVLNTGSTGYAILLSTGALGAMVGSIVLPLAQNLFRNSKAIVICITGYSLTLIGLALSKSIILSGIFLGLGGFFHVIWFTVIIILLQTLPDDKHKGRVVGLFFTFIQLYGLGFIIGGALGDTIGINPTIFIGSASLIIVHVACYLISPSFRSLRS